MNNAPEYWGTNADGFDCGAESDKIASAAESAGIEVIRNPSDHRPLYTDDGEERTEIGWFDQWCGGGYEWTAKQWEEWFAARAN